MRARSRAVLAALLLAGCGAHRPRPAAEAACRAAEVDPAVLRAHVEALTTRFQPRSAAHPDNLLRAADFLAEAFHAAGAEVRAQDYLALGGTYRNVIASYGPDT